MTKPTEQQAPTALGSPTTWDVYCPEEDLAVLPGFPSKQAAGHAAAEHNAQFTPRHSAVARKHTPGPEDPPPHLTPAQREAFQQNESDFAELENRSRSVREAAEARLRHADYDPGGPLYCYVCTCSSFVAPDDDGGLDARCEREFCRHTSMQHA
ncbi:hypothetical protein M2164_000900 [Streptomyces sp. SAI-208]|jgi:hypothetical protein|uniref:hypothetical protein n=1 Tax=unclassified Streptomyces TaxID=2593676 RepID=UPI0024749B9B|nr:MULTISPECIES: hypothetical protein [unclassified Streptomyces]MDH6514422.1 hypothetical protein [Streptomyces sp. SAI-090]MDH6546603.1 hypothetical protein [Streptomyces sp. SAI-041]MDH6565704.1 hypothetical protein [Streptomyces sp. SAI-117]MDH6589377.1 hypothetical protein [Streptomyces sp. SAI-133]MDH6605265.1 hypothetical protein [Streptomyces sp. SAI-208]